MAEVLTATDVETFLVSYLSTALAARSVTATVSVSVPDVLPEKLVVVRRDGGARVSRVLEQARLGIRVWAVDDPTVNDLAALVAGLILACPDGPNVTDAQLLSGPQSVEEPNPNRRLRYLTAQVLARCSAV